jgi:hypothetical protein
MSITDRRARKPIVANGLVGVGLLAAAAFSVSGCIIVDDHADPYLDDHIVIDDGHVHETIDADESLQTELGEGVGLFVEYYAGGTWVLWTSCDSYLTDLACDFQVQVVTYSPLGDVTTSDFEAGDDVDVVADDELWFYALTSTDTEVVEFGADPGQAIEVELWVDGYVEPRFIYWVGDGLIHEGAVGSPVIFEPSSA